MPLWHGACGAAEQMAGGARWAQRARSQRGSTLLGYLPNSPRRGRAPTGRYQRRRYEAALPSWASHGGAKPRELIWYRASRRDDNPLANRSASIRHPGTRGGGSPFVRTQIVMDTPCDLMTPNGGLLSIIAAARILDVHPGTLRNWLSQGRLPFVKVGRLTKLRRRDIGAFVERQTVTHDRGSDT